MNDNSALDCQSDIYSVHWWKYFVDELFDPSLTPEEYQPIRPMHEVAPEDRLTLVNIEGWVVEDRVRSEEIMTTLPSGNFSFTVKKTAAESGRAGFSILVGRTRLQYCDCVVSTAISSSDGRSHDDHYVAREVFEAPVSLTIQREGGLLYFYLNGKYAHSLEFESIGELLNFSFSNGRRLSDEAPLPSFDVEIYEW